MKKKTKNKKTKVKMTVDGYYTDDNGFWTIYKTESGMTVMKKDKKNAAFIIALLSSTSQGMGHFVRTAAPVKFYAKDVSSGIVEEHTICLLYTSDAADE